jgi:hypothetical protein
MFDRIYEEPFPSEEGKEVLGIDLVLLDSDTMGLVSQFITNKGLLTVERIIMLEHCFSDLKKIVIQLDKKEKLYFTSLIELATETLYFLSR